MVCIGDPNSSNYWYPIDPLPPTYPTYPTGIFYPVTTTTTTIDKSTEILSSLKLVLSKLDTILARLDNIELRLKDKITNNNKSEIDKILKERDNNEKLMLKSLGLDIDKLLNKQREEE